VEEAEEEEEEEEEEEGDSKSDRGHTRAATRSNRPVGLLSDIYWFGTSSDWLWALGCDCGRYHSLYQDHFVYNEPLELTAPQHTAVKT
jgi:hypothetical protein